MPEELALEQPLGKRTAVARLEARLRATAERRNGGIGGFLNSQFGFDANLPLVRAVGVTRDEESPVPDAAKVRASAPAITDTVAGQVQLMYTTTVSGETQIKAGRVKVIGVASAKRVALLPDVPTLAESGIKDAEALVWFGMAGPLGLPHPIVDKLNREVNRALTLPDVKARLDQLGLEVAGGTPEEFAKFINSEAAKVTRLITAGLLQTD